MFNQSTKTTSGTYNREHLIQGIGDTESDAAERRARHRVTQRWATAGSHRHSWAALEPLLSHAWATGRSWNLDHFKSRSWSCCQKAEPWKKEERFWGETLAPSPPAPASCHAEPSSRSREGRQAQAWRWREISSSEGLDACSSRFCPPSPRSPPNVSWVRRNLKLHRHSVLRTWGPSGWHPCCSLSQVCMPSQVGFWVDQRGLLWQWRTSLGPVVHD